MHKVMANADFGSVEHFYSKYCDRVLRAGLTGAGVHTHRAIDKLWAPQHLFDRVVATSLFSHLAEPETVLLGLERVTNPAGLVITILVPFEPRLLLRLSRKILTARKTKRIGFAGYELFTAREHKNYISRLDKLVKQVFQKNRVTISRLPIYYLSLNLNLYFMYKIFLGRDVQEYA